MQRSRTLLLTLAVLATALCPATAQCWLETAKVYASDGVNGDRFRVPALDGDTLVVGAHFDSDDGLWSGSAYVFEQVGSGPWTEVIKLTASDADERDQFGYAVAVDGDTAVVGAYHDDLGTSGYIGSAYVFDRSGGSWVEVAKLVSASAAEGSFFGTSVAIDGDTIAVGAPGSLNVGAAVHVFRRDAGGPGAWGETAVLSSVGAEPYYGQSVSLEGDTLVVGAPGCCGSGEVFVCERNANGAGAWGEVVRLPGPPVYARFGASVSLSGHTLAVGATREDPAALYVFERDLGGPDNWGQAAKLFASVVDPSSGFGESVAASGDAIVCSAWSESTNGLNSGSAYVFERDLGGPGVWAEAQRLWPADPEDIDWYGRWVAISGDLVACGATQGNGVVNDTGAVYLHRRYAAATASTYCTAGLSTSGCRASISACGVPSASAPDGFALYVSGVEGTRNGLFFFGTNGRQAAPWGTTSSLLCAVPPVTRGAKQFGVGTSGTCDGLFAQDLGALWSAKPWKNPGSGAVVQAQFWYRDPQSSGNKGTGLSDAVEFVVGP